MNFNVSLLSILAVLLCNATKPTSDKANPLFDKLYVAFQNDIGSESSDGSYYDFEEPEDIVKGLSEYESSIYEFQDRKSLNQENFRRLIHNEKHIAGELVENGVQSVPNLLEEITATLVLEKSSATISGQSSTFPPTNFSRYFTLTSPTSISHLVTSPVTQLETQISAKLSSTPLFPTSKASATMYNMSTRSISPSPAINPSSAVDYPATENESGEYITSIPDIDQVISSLRTISQTGIQKVLTSADLSSPDYKETFALSLPSTTSSVDASPSPSIPTAPAGTWTPAGSPSLTEMRSSGLTSVPAEPRAQDSLTNIPATDLLMLPGRSPVPALPSNSTSKAGQQVTISTPENSARVATTETLAVTKSSDFNAQTLVATIIESRAATSVASKFSSGPNISTTIGQSPPLSEIAKASSTSETSSMASAIGQFSPLSEIVKAPTTSESSRMVSAISQSSRLSDLVKAPNTSESPRMTTAISQSSPLSETIEALEASNPRTSESPQATLAQSQASAFSTPDGKSSTEINVPNSNPRITQETKNRSDTVRIPQDIFVTTTYSPTRALSAEIQSSSSKSLKAESLATTLNAGNDTVTTVYRASGIPLSPPRLPYTKTLPLDSTTSTGIRAARVTEPWSQSPEIGHLSSASSTTTISVSDQSAHTSKGIGRISESTTESSTPSQQSQPSSTTESGTSQTDFLLYSASSLSETRRSPNLQASSTSFPKDTQRRSSSASPRFTSAIVQEEKTLLVSDEIISTTLKTGEIPSISDPLPKTDSRSSNYRFSTSARTNEGALSTIQQPRLTSINAGTAQESEVRFGSPVRTTHDVVNGVLISTTTGYPNVPATSTEHILAAALQASTVQQDWTTSSVVRSSSSAGNKNFLDSSNISLAGTSSSKLIAAKPSTAVSELQKRTASEAGTEFFSTTMHFRVQNATESATTLVIYEQSSPISLMSNTLTIRSEASVEITTNPTIIKKARNDSNESLDAINNTTYLNILPLDTSFQSFPASYVTNTTGSSFDSSDVLETGQLRTSKERIHSDNQTNTLPHVTTPTGMESSRIEGIQSSESSLPFLALVSSTESDQGTSTVASSEESDLNTIRFESTDLMKTSKSSSSKSPYSMTLHRDEMMPDTSMSLSSSLERKFTTTSENFASPYHLVSSASTIPNKFAKSSSTQISIASTSQYYLTAFETQRTRLATSKDILVTATIPKIKDLRSTLSGYAYLKF